MPFLDESREEMLRHIKPGGVGAEVGVQVGYYAGILLRRAKPRKLLLIDLWEHQDADVYVDDANFEQERHDEFYQRVLKRHAAAIEAGTVEIRKGYSCDELAKIPDNFLDWIYIDANHSYEGVLADLKEAYRVVKPTGLIMGHDYADWWEKGSKCGVIPAVTSFLNAHRELALMAITKVTENDWNPSYIIGSKGTTFPSQESD